MQRTSIALALASLAAVTAFASAPAAAADGPWLVRVRAVNIDSVSYTHLTLPTKRIV